jgi:pyruvate dehydrogenase E2 component (dihydrolipoamide acetyltransferase)
MANEITVSVPDIGDFKDVEIIEVLISPGDEIKAEDSLITLESDKAAMEIPSPAGGVVKSVAVKVGDRVTQGTAILVLEPSEAAAPAAKPAPAQPEAPKPEPAADAATPPPARPSAPVPAPAAAAPFAEPGKGNPHASPSVRRFARELGADLTVIGGTGPKSRILKEDVQNYVKTRLAATSSGPALGFSIPEAPQIDFSQFGPIESKPLSRINKLSAANLHRNWISIPHVTLHEAADITELESFRVSLKGEAEKQGVKVTLLPFLIRAVVATLKAYPRFNASLSANGEELILKQYHHIGVAVDTPDGLVVPVVRDAGGKGVIELARELAELGERARGKKLKTQEMQGGSFTISSLGGIGSTSFTPIINAPEVAILGVSKAQIQPVWKNGQFEPRLMLPLSLSFDHRVIDGAEAARFTAYLAKTLSDLRRLVL